MADFIERKTAKCFLAEHGYSTAVGLLDYVQAADVQPVKHGKWTLNKDGSATCSECHHTQQGAWDLDNWDNFCHFCGADMREVYNDQRFYNN